MFSMPLNFISKTFNANYFSPKKLLCMSRRGTYTSDTHQVTTAALRSEQMCNYDLDELDQRWLNAANGERAQMGK